MSDSEILKNVGEVYGGYSGGGSMDAAEYVNMVQERLASIKAAHLHMKSLSSRLDGSKRYHLLQYFLHLSYAVAIDKLKESFRISIFHL